jgi:hypothetical protein
MTSTSWPIRIAGPLLLAGAALVLLSGCNSYDCEVVLRPDGSGIRTVTLEVSKDIRADARALSEMAVLFRMGDEEAPCEALPDQKEGEQKGFRCHYVARRLADWSAMSAHVIVQGSASEGEHQRVRLQQSVGVEMGHTARGRTYTYRESLTWKGIWEAVADFQARLFRQKMAAAYPFLETAQLAELEGLFDGAMLVALQTQLDLEEGGISPEPLTSSVSERASRIVQEARPAADVSGIRDLVAGVVSDADNATEDFLDRSLPGVDAAVFTSYTLRVKMPGRIVESNATRIEDGTAIWELDLGDPLQKPLQLEVRSELPD